MKASKIKSIIMNEGITESCEILEEEFKERASIKVATSIFILCIGILVGMFFMYLIEK